jgi:hypothetical protein
MKNIIKIVYIAGYGRSGSTILETLISQNDNIVSSGALVNIFSWFNKNEKCACSKRVQDCDFWSKIISCDLKAVTRKCENVRKKIESLSGFPGLMFGIHRKNYTGVYSECMEELYRNIALTSKKNVIVDSSKSCRWCTGRPLAIQKYTNIQVKVVFITRDVRGVAWSTIKGAGSKERRRFINNKYFQCIKSSISWSLTNLLVTIMKKKIAKENFLQVKYEDLVRNPSAQLKRIEELVDEDMDGVIEKVRLKGSLTTGHILGGNRLRFNKKQEFRPDLAWKNEMPFRFRVLSEIISFPVRKLLGY